MKKRFIAFLAVIMSMLVGFTALTGCNLVTPNDDRDLEQVVATVQINPEIEKESIYKKDLIMGYLNYGYMYVQSYGYTQAQTFEMILDNLVNNRLYVQHAMTKFENDGAVADGTKAKFTLDRYLSADEIKNAQYDAIKSMNDLIDSYEEAEEAVQDSIWETVRTAPTNATQYEEDVKKDTAKRDAYIAKGIVTGKDANGKVDDTRYKAYAKVLKLLKANGLLGENVTDIATSTYYSDVLKSYKESALVEKYEEAITKEVLLETTYAQLSARYAEMYLDQQEKYEGDATAFAEALSSASAQSPIFYNGVGGYGYVYNLLLGVSTEQSTALTNYKTDNPNTTTAEYNKARNDILQATVVKDLRSTWIQSGYDFDLATKTFTGDYTFAKDSANSLPFYGEIIDYQIPADEHEHVKYGVKSVETFGLESFLDMMDLYLGTTRTLNTDETDPVYATAEATGIVEYQAKINELLFAFSTDSGSLNPYKGYVIAPEPDFDGKDQWVIEFADAGRQLLTMGDNSYIIVASDYGYHVLFYSEVLKTDAQSDTLDKFLNAEYGDKDWAVEYANMISNWFEDDLDTDNYLYTLTNLNVSSKVTAKQQSVIDGYMYPSNGVECVEKFESAYSDLISE